MKDFVTIYLTYMPLDSEVHALEAELGREIGVGSDYVNVYTQDVEIVRKAVELIDVLGCNVKEISFG